MLFECVFSKEVENIVTHTTEFFQMDNQRKRLKLVEEDNYKTLKETLFVSWFERMRGASQIAPSLQVFQLFSENGHYLREPLPLASLLVQFAGCISHVYFWKSTLIRDDKMADEYFFGKFIILYVHFQCFKLYFYKNFLLIVIYL